MRRRLFHYSYLLLLRCMEAYLRVHFIFHPVAKKFKNASGILALPAYPEGWPGGVERIANWKKYFEKYGITYDVSWSCAKAEYKEVMDRKLDFKKWIFHLRILLSRLKTFKTISNYQTIYIQRELIPLYDTRYIGIDQLIMNSHPNVVYDFYDADYESTPKLTYFIFNNAKKISVASKFLKERIQQNCSNVLFTRISLPVPLKREMNRDSGRIRIGWMGSPGNARNLVDLEDTFSALQKQFSHIEFSFVCRNPPSLNCTSILWSDMNSTSFHYGEWLNTIDIGIVPYMDLTDRTKAKTAMKSLEFWANSIALVCSPFGMSDKIEDGFNCLIAYNTGAWIEKITKLICDSFFRSTLAGNGYNTFSQFHTYEANFEELRDFLICSPK